MARNLHCMSQCHGTYIVCHNVTEPTLYVTISRNLLCMLLCYWTYIVCHNVTEPCMSQYHGTFIVCHNVTEPILYSTMSRNIMYVSWNLHCQNVKEPSLYVKKSRNRIFMPWNPICISRNLVYMSQYHGIWCICPELYILCPNVPVSNFSRACAQYSDFLNRAQLLTQNLLKQVITTNILRSSSQSGLPLRNIHISNDNRSFTFYVDFFLFSITANTFTGLYCIYE